MKMMIQEIMKYLTNFFKSKSHLIFFLVLLLITITTTQLFYSSRNLNSYLITNTGSFNISDAIKINPNETIFQEYSSSGAKEDSIEILSDTSEMVLLNTRSDEIKELLHTYIQQHSQEALQNEIQSYGPNTTRQYAIGYYSCPMQAGNRLHHFMNSLIWSIVTNRTMLWKYYDQQVCKRVGFRNDPKICKAANTVEDCDNVLERASWLASFDEWNPILRFDSLESLSFWSTTEKLPNHKLWKEGNEKLAGIADTTASRLIEFAPLLGQDATVLRRERKRKYLLNTTAAQDRARILLQNGPDYLYGLIFRSSFSFRPSISTEVYNRSGGEEFSIEDSEYNQNQNVTVHETNEDPLMASISVVLHSRHSDPKDDGSNTKREEKCLKQIFQNDTNMIISTGKCQVILLSDRPKCLKGINNFVRQTYPNCIVKIAKHDVEMSFRKEHGPFAGVGFYEDLKLVVDSILDFPTRRTAFLGSKGRSSSQLVREMVVYELEERARNDDERNLLTCYWEDI